MTFGGHQDLGATNTIFDALWCWFLTFPKCYSPKFTLQSYFSISHRPKWLLYHGISSEIPSPKRKKKTALLRNLGQALKSGLPCSLKGFVWDIHQGRAKTNQLNTPGILCILRSVGSCFFLRRDSSIELICLFQKWGIPANYQFMGNIMINHGLLGCTVFRSN